jgi:tetratricopeptide (TPR) repeat protein
MQESISTASRKLDYNALLLNGYTSFQNKEVAHALSCYQEALRVNSDPHSCALVQSVIGVLHMHSCNYASAIESFNEGLRLVENIGAERQGNSSYEFSSVLIKLQANLALCNLVVGEHRQALDLVASCLAVVRAATPTVRSDLFQSLMYIFYRFTSFAGLKAAEYDGAESKCTIHLT